ncbi:MULTISPECIES: VOC family protein [unclassified Rhodococcus (in: high G+C Gram-positive bacteria)]|uniref:VOC family protein n=1 Tax=unclassified Rhodococcus (in: high G+C Gram-positive bacteria) TaxID=192944 RepID=UPI00047F5BF1|nr:MULTISPECIES: VOC family protein [unclassified Rhodococcus (in: high G+C Gram-positive bacteria)]MDQ1202677.1 putative enzyme related to lactoylglutathione lyase [Rhodococcus sp. SORGH_AS_0303]
MPAPNLFLIGVRDGETATSFYSDLFEIEPTFISPHYVAFQVAPGVLFALWTGYSEHLAPDTPGTTEVGLMVPGSASAVDEVFANWVSKGVRVVDEPYDAVFGRTFVVSDPDGNLIRVSPID